MKKMISGIALSLFIGSTALASQQPAQAAGAGANADTASASIPKRTHISAKNPEVSRIVNADFNNPPAFLDKSFIDPLGIFLDTSFLSRGQWKPDMGHWLLAVLLLRSEADHTFFKKEYFKAINQANDDHEEESTWAAQRWGEFFYLASLSADDKTRKSSEYMKKTQNRINRLKHFLAYEADSFEDHSDRHKYLELWFDWMEKNKAIKKQAAKTTTTADATPAAKKS